MLTDNLCIRQSNSCSYCNTQPQNLSPITQKKAKPSVCFSLAPLSLKGISLSAMPSRMHAFNITAQDDPHQAWKKVHWPFTTWLRLNTSQLSLHLLPRCHNMTNPTAWEARKCSFLCALEEENKMGFGGLIALSLPQLRCHAKLGGWI